MKGTFKIENLAEAEATLTVTMAVAAWRKLEKQIASDHPGWEFSEQIRHMIGAFESHWREYTDDDE